MEKEYYFFITKSWFNENGKMIIGYLFLLDGTVMKKRLYTSGYMFDRDKLKEYLLIKFSNFSYYSEKDRYGIFVSNTDIIATKQLHEEDYNKFRTKYFKKTLEDIQLNPNLSENEVIEARKEIEESNSFLEYHKDLEQRWDENYNKNWVSNDTGQDSDLTDSDSDGSYLYEDNSNPTNSDYFHKSNNNQ